MKRVHLRGTYFLVFCEVPVWKEVVWTRELEKSRKNVPLNDKVSDDQSNFTAQNMNEDDENNNEDEDDLIREDEPIKNVDGELEVDSKTNPNDEGYSDNNEEHGDDNNNENGDEDLNDVNLDDEEEQEDEAIPEEELDPIDPDDELRPFLLNINLEDEEARVQPLGFKVSCNRAKNERFVTHVEPESRAEMAGFQKGDRILGINGELLYFTPLCYFQKLMKNCLEDEECDNIELLVISEQGQERFNKCFIRVKYLHIDIKPPKEEMMTIDEVEMLQAKEDQGQVVLPTDKYTMDETDERGAMPNEVIERAVDVKTPDSVDPYDYTIMNLGQLQDLCVASMYEPAARIRSNQFSDWIEAVDAFDDL